MMATHVQKVCKLYKTILKLHRGLPEELQVVGTNYTRDEFKRHKKCTPEEANVFMHEWTNYAIIIAKQLGMRGPGTSTTKFGKELNKDCIETLRAEQIHQLYELMVAAKLETDSKT